MAEQNELADVKGILEHYFSEQLGEGAPDDIAQELLAKVQKQRNRLCYETRQAHKIP